MNKNKEIGNLGENIASDYLNGQGHRILRRNYSCRFGEIDIISECDGYIIFSEVKLRKNSLYGNAREFVNYSKQQRIFKTAEYYLMENPTDLQPRFDVIEIYQNGPAAKPVINLIENAF